MTNRHAAIEIDWADGTYTFRLGLGEIEELERSRDRSIFTITAELDPKIRRARSTDIIEVLRLGLIGGGMTPVDALAKVRRYVDQRPLDENRDAAYLVALAALMRLNSSETEPPSGEAASPGEGLAAQSSASTSPPSTEPRP